MHTSVNIKYPNVIVVYKVLLKCPECFWKTFQILLKTVKGEATKKNKITSSPYFKFKKGDDSVQNSDPLIAVVKKTDANTVNPSIGPLIYHKFNPFR